MGTNSPQSFPVSRLMKRTKEHKREKIPPEAKRYHGLILESQNGKGPLENRQAILSTAELSIGRPCLASPEDTTEVGDWNRFRLYTNFEVQGIGADALKLAIVKLDSNLEEHTRIVLPVRDALLVQCPQQPSTDCR